MKKEFLINIVFLISINLLIKPFYLFGIDRTVQNVTGPEVYGLFWALFNFTYIFQVVNDFGLQNFTSKFISQNRNLMHKYFGHLCSLKLVTGFVFGCCVFLIAWLLGYPASYWTLILPIAINQVLVSFIFLFRSNIAGLGHYRLDSVVSVLDKALMILICSILLWGSVVENFTIYHFIFAQSLTLCITLLVGFFIVRSKTAKISLKWHVPTMISFLRRSAPYALALFLTTVYARVDGVMLERLLENGQAETGIYAGAYRLLEAGNMFTFLFAGLLLPMFSFQLKSKKDISPLFNTAIKLIWFIVISAVCLVVSFRYEIVTLLYAHADVYWGDVLGVLMFGFIGMGLSYIFGSLLLAGENVKKLNWILFGGMVLNVVLNWVLIPHSGALGAAKATLLTQSLVAIFSFVLVKRILSISTPVTIYISMITFALFAGGSCWIMVEMVPSIGWMLKFIILGLFFAIVGLLTDHFHIRQLWKDKQNGV